jgi:hypothetical protein
MSEFWKKMETDAFAVMTDDQRAKWLEHRVLQSFIMQFYAYNLTDDQKSKMKQAAHTLAQEKGATFASLWAKMEQETFSNILTDEQKTTWLQYATLQYIDGMYRGAKLTDDQKAKVKENYVKLVADGGTPAPAMLKDIKGMSAAMMDMFKKLSPQVDAMLSNEQKAAQDKWMHPKKKNAPTSAPAYN